MHLINYFVYYCVFSPRFVFLRWFSRNGENHAKSMQNGAKRSKNAKAKNPTARNMSTGWKGLRRTCRQVWCGTATAARSAHAMRAGDAAHSAQAVDWIMQPVDWMECTGKNQSTGSWQRVQHRNPSLRKEQRNLDFQRSLTLKNQNSQSRRNFAKWSTVKL